MKRGGYLKRRTPLRRIGRRGAARRERLHVARQLVFARDGYRCQVRAWHCTGRAEHAHHVLPRSRGGDEALENLLTVCAACHGWVHDHPAEATGRGFLR